MEVALLASLLMGIPLLMGAAFLLGRHLHRRQQLRDEISPVSRQHIDLFQGGQLSESAVESAKLRIRDLLERGEVAAVEASMRPGMQYVVQVRALTELGTDDAGRILERQLYRRLSDDKLEQSCYWIDLANGLRSLNHSQSLPALLQCAERAGDVPLCHYFAAETVCFLGFNGYLRQLDTPLGRAALRVLLRAFEGLRLGVQAQMVAEARLGAMVEELWDRRGEVADPLVTRIFSESLRVLRRAPHAELALGPEESEQEAFSWQMSRIAALEPSLEDYLEEAPRQLCPALEKAGPAEQRDLLLALTDLHAETAPVVVPLLQDLRLASPELAVESLTWSKDPEAAQMLREWALRRIPMARRAQRRRQYESPRRPSVSADIPYRSILRALRGHPSVPTEAFLVLAARDWDPMYRAAAVSSLGWWEPLQRAEVLSQLQAARRDTNSEVRQAARAALARLGERQALQWFRQNLTNEDPQKVHETIQAVATEAITFLWPDLDRLADAENLDVAHHAREALERLCEEMDQQS